MFNDNVPQHTSQVCVCMCVLYAEMFLVYVIVHNICCRVLSCREMVCVQKKVLQQVYLAMHVRLRAGVCLCVHVQGKRSQWTCTTMLLHGKPELKQCKK